MSMSARAAVTKYPTLGGLNSVHLLTVLEAEKSKCTVLRCFYSEASSLGL